MKLTTLRNGSRDGELIVISRDLQRACRANDIAPTMLQAVEQWARCEPLLQARYDALNAGRADDAFALDVRALAAPLPRGPQWLGGSAFNSHGELMSKVFGVEDVQTKTGVPLVYQGASDDFLGACDDVPVAREADQIDFEAEIGVVLDHVPMGTNAIEALQHIRLFVLLDDVSLRAHTPREMRTGFGFVHAKTSTVFSPVAVTPDELGDAWRDGRVHLPLHVEWNGQPFGHPDAGHMSFTFGELIAHVAHTRHLSAGTIVGSGTVSNYDYREVGSACIAERRGIETLDQGKPVTSYMKFGDRVRIDMFGADGMSICGAIDHRVVSLSEAG
jgi:fumarylacetoacetate (FAA) hydrolase